MTKRAMLTLTKPAIVASTLAGVAVISGAVYTVAHRASYARGIEQTTAALNQVNEQLAENVRWGDAFLVNKAAPAFAAEAAGAAGLAEIREAITQIVRLGESREGLQRGDYTPAVRNGIKNALSVYGQTGAPGSSVAAIGVRTTDWALRLVESYVILSERSRLLRVRDDLENALDTLKRREGRPPANDDQPPVPAAERAVTADPQWVETLKAASAHLATMGEQDLFRKAMGAELVHPDSMDALDGVPNLNPDWVEAVQKCRRAAINLDFDLWATCDRYPNGEYIPAFRLGTSNLVRSSAPAPSDGESAYPYEGQYEVKYDYRLTWPGDEQRQQGTSAESVSEFKGNYLFRDLSRFGGYDNENYKLCARTFKKNGETLFTSTCDTTAYQDTDVHHVHWEARLEFSDRGLTVHSVETRRIETFVNGRLSKTFVEQSFSDGAGVRR